MIPIPIYLFTLFLLTFIVGATYYISRWLLRNKNDPDVETIGDKIAKLKKGVPGCDTDD